MSLLDTKEGREALQWGLVMAASIDAGGVVCYSAGTGRGKHLKAEAYSQVVDPASLAHILAEVDHAHEYVVSGNTIERCCWGRNKRLVTLDIWTMPEARSALAKLLQLPDGAQKDAERVLQGET